MRALLGARERVPFAERADRTSRLLGASHQVRIELTFGQDGVQTPTVEGTDRGERVEHQRQVVRQVPIEGARRALCVGDHAESGRTDGWVGG